MAPSSLGSEQIIYAQSLNATEGDLDNRESFFRNNEFLMSALINEGLPDSTILYYEKAHDSDLLACGNLLLRRRQMAKGRRDRLSLEDIFTTGLPQGDVDRYCAPS